MDPFSTTPPLEYKPGNFFPLITDEYGSFVRNDLLFNMMREKGKFSLMDKLKPARVTEPFDVEKPIFHVNYPNLRPLKSGQSFAFASMLSSQVGNLVRCVRRENDKFDFVAVDAKECLKGKDFVLIVCVFVPVKWCEENARELCQLSLISSELLPNTTFEMVFVPKLRKKPDIDDHYGVDDFHTFFSAFPGRLTLPCTEQKVCDYFCRRFNFKGPLTCVLVSCDKLLEVHDFVGNDLFCFGSDGFPFTSAKRHQLENEITQLPLPLAKLLGVDPSHNLMNLDHSSSITIEDLSKKVVGLYLFRTGIDFKLYDQVYQQCRARGEESRFEIVLICVPSSSIHPHVFQTEVLHVLAHLKLLNSFWYFPYNNSACCRLCRLSTSDHSDAMIIVGPESEYVEPYGGKLLSAFGMDGFPFDRELLLEKYVNKLEEVTLQSLLSRDSVEYVLTPDKKRMSITELQGKNVVLYVDHMEHVSTETFKTVRDWCQEMEKQQDFAVVYILCRNSDDDNMVIKPFQDTSWLEYPCDSRHSNYLQAHEAFFVDALRAKTSVGLCPPKVVLFGEDGHIHMIEAEHEMVIHGNKVNLFNPELKDLRHQMILKFRAVLRFF